eukprot:g11025.t1
MFDPYELNTLVSGDLRETGFDVADLRANTVLSGGYEEGWVQVRAGAWNMRAVGTPGAHEGIGEEPAKRDDLVSQAQTLHIKSALQGSDEHLPSSASEAHTSVVALADFCEVQQAFRGNMSTGSFSAKTRNSMSQSDLSDMDGKSYSGISAASDCSTRSSHRKHCRNLKLVETMGHVPSAALQLVINNPGTLESVYTIERELGKGAFGTVRLGRIRATGAKRAVKTISKEKMKESQGALKLEIEIMKMLDHPSVVMLFESDNILLKVSPTEPLTKTSLRVSDFGLSRLVEDGEYLSTSAGTPSHMAPEVHEKRSNHKSDVWSCGVILYYIYCGELPFKSEEETKKGRYKVNGPVWSKADPVMLTFLSMLLCKRPGLRYSARRALNDEWLQRKGGASGRQRKGLLEELRAFRSLNKFKRAAICTAVSMLPEQDIADSRELFLRLDLDGDGTVSAQDLKKAGSLVVGFEEQALSSLNVRKACGVTDKFQSFMSTRAFTYTEFLAATIDQEVYTTPKLLRAAFDCFDRDQDSFGATHFEPLRSTSHIHNVRQEELGAEDLGRFLMFVTSCSRAPLLGFKNLNPKFCVHRVPDGERLPTSATCANLLKLPDYTSYQSLKTKVLQAIRAEAGFDLS